MISTNNPKIWLWIAIVFGVSLQSICFEDIKYDLTLSLISPHYVEGKHPKIRDKIKDVQSPILVLQGQCDFLSYAASYEYVDLYPNSQYISIENAGHEIWWEQEEEYIKEIIEFINE